MTLLLVLLAVLLEIAHELCFKLGAGDRIKARAWLAVGVVFWGLEILTWIRVLQLVPLSVAFPMMSLCYAGLPLAGRALLKEPVGRKQWAGIGLITLGVAAIGMSGVG